MIDIYKRQTNGMLERMNVVSQIPSAKSGDFYCADVASADPANHVAVEFQLINTSQELPDGLPQLATYTADASGNLSTASTRQNMPSVAMQYVYDLKILPPENFWRLEVPMDVAKVACRFFTSTVRNRSHVIPVC